MSATAPEFPENLPVEDTSSDLVGMFNIYIEPKAVAPHIFHKWFWVWPFLVTAIVGLTVALLMMPITQHVIEITPAPPNVDAAQYQKSIGIGLMIQKIASYCAPLFVLIGYCVTAALLMLGCAMLDIKAKFLQLFNVAAAGSLISMLAYVATLIIIKAKGEISTQAELRPPLGLDIFMGESANKYLKAFLSYFNIFELWWIVAITIVIAAAFRVKKGKAFTALVPIIFLSVLFRLVGAAFQR